MNIMTRKQIVAVFLLMIFLSQELMEALGKMIQDVQRNKPGEGKIFPSPGMKYGLQRPEVHPP